MKFSVASRILEPDAEGWEETVEGCGVEVEVCALEGSATVAGRFTRRRSVARGHSILGCQRKKDGRRGKGDHTSH